MSNCILCVVRSARQTLSATFVSLQTICLRSGSYRSVVASRRHGFCETALLTTCLPIQTGRRIVTNLLNNRDCLDFTQNALRKCLRSYTGTCRFADKILLINCVKCGKVRHVRKETGGLDHLFIAAAAVIFSVRQGAQKIILLRETAEDNEREHLITGIAGRKNFVAVHIQKAHMSDKVGFLRQALSVFERYGVSIEHVPTGVDSFGVVVNGADVRESIYYIVSDLQQELKPDVINVVDQLALISVVGRNMNRRAGISGRVFGSLGEAGINIRMITQSSQEISIIMGVNNSDFERAINVIYRSFVEGEMVDIPSKGDVQ